MISLQRTKYDVKNAAIKMVAGLAWKRHENYSTDYKSLAPAAVPCVPFIAVSLFLLSRFFLKPLLSCLGNHRSGSGITFGS